MFGKLSHRSWIGDWTFSRLQVSCIWRCSSWRWFRLVDERLWVTTLYVSTISLSMMVGTIEFLQPCRSLIKNKASWVSVRVSFRYFPSTLLSILLIEFGLLSHFSRPGLIWFYVVTIIIPVRTCQLRVVVMSARHCCHFSIYESTFLQFGNNFLLGLAGTKSNCDFCSAIALSFDVVNSRRHLDHMSTWDLVLVTGWVTVSIWV